MHFGTPSGYNMSNLNNNPVHTIHIHYILQISFGFFTVNTTFSMLYNMTEKKYVFMYKDRV